MLQNDAAELLSWYEDNKRSLPWRRDTEPYAVLVSEIMLQQTTVAAVIPKYESWMARFPTPERLAEASLEEVMSQWSGLGYYQRARRLHQAAQVVKESGGFPDDFESIQKLPGVGPYTAAALASICLEHPVLAVDTNVIRVLFRYYGVAATATDRSVIRGLHERTRVVWDWVRAGDFNQALMELGATVCAIKAPRCRECPLRRGCRGRLDPAGPERFPLPSRKKEPRLTPGRALVLQRADSDRVLLVKGTSLGLLADLHQPILLFDDHTPPEFEELATRLESESGLACGELSYGISGRRLQLRVGLWKLSGDQLDELKKQLAGFGWKAAYYSTSDSNAPAVSTLTRKVLKRAWESL